MKILYIHNNYTGDNSGEELAAESLVRLLQTNGHQVIWYRRSSTELSTSKLKEYRAFFTGIWNPSSTKKIKKLIAEFKPDVIQIQNLYPLISPAIIKMIKKSGIPVVLRTPNYRLFCPTGLHLDNKGELCEKCLTPGREIHCLLKNCKDDILKSMGYSIRNFAARTVWGIYDDIDKYIVQSEFQRNKFIQNGLLPEKISILPGLAPELSYSDYSHPGKYVTFVGRVSLEKGIVEFIQAARLLPNVPFVVVGKLDKKLNYLKHISSENVLWTGFLKDIELDKIYVESRIIVVPSKWYEGFPNVITRAMKHAKPVITCNLGAMSSIIDNGINGILVAPGNSIELQKAILSLYSDTALCTEMGKKGKEKAMILYSSDQIYNSLINMYEGIIHTNINN